jgi:drug/metabolite transporter (DMT)-like permease
MAQYAIFAILSAVGISAYAILTKVILRYRLCSGAYVAFATGAASGILSLAGLVIIGSHFPREASAPLIVATISGFGALYAAARAIQEGDPSTVVPVMGLKIPFVAVMSVFLLAEIHHWHIYLAAVLAFVGVILFGLGPQQKAQGGHGYSPLVGILWAAASAGLYALSDVYIKRSLAFLAPIPAAMWNYTFIGLLCVPALLQPHLRQYRVTRIDVGLLFLNGLFLLLAVMAFFVSISLAGQITTPNILFATRGFITLAAGYALNRLLKTPIERQPNSVYILRILGTAMLFAAILLAI